MDSVNQIAIHDALKKRLETDPRSLADYRTQGNNPKKFHPESFSCHLELILSLPSSTMNQFVLHATLEMIMPKNECNEV